VRIYVFYVLGAKENVMNVAPPLAPQNVSVLAEEFPPTGGKKGKKRRANDDEDDDVVDVRDRDNDAEDEENRKEREKALLAEKRTKTFQRLTLLHGQDYFPWIKTSSRSDGVSALDHYLRTATVVCICCKTELNGSDPSNIAKHQGTRHNENWDKHRSAAQLQILLQNQRKGALEGPAARLRKEKARILRGVTAACIVGGGTNPHQIDRIFGSESNIPDALDTLKEASMPFGAATTVKSDLEEVEGMVKDLIKTKAKYTTGALIIDGATFNHEHGMGVAYSSAYLPEPLFLGIIFAVEDPDAEDGWSYDANQCSEDIREMLDEYGITLKQIVCLMGDNVTFNDKVAGVLGLERGKCVAHALSLTVKNAVLSLEGFKELVVTSSGLLYAGGSNSRAIELKRRGVNPRTSVVYPNRFASVVDPAAVRLEHFDIFKEFHLDGNIFPLTEASIKQGDADIEDVKSTVNKAKKVAVAYESPSAKLVLAICGVMFATVPKLISEASSNSGHLPSTFPESLSTYQRLLSACYRNPQSVTDQAQNIAYPTDLVVVETPAVKKAKEAISKIATELNPSVKLAAKIALDSFNKHIEPMMRFFKKGTLYNVNTPVDVAPDSSRLTKDVVGCFASHYGPAIVDEFVKYQENVMRLIEEDELKPPIWTPEVWNTKTPEERDAHIFGRYGYLNPSKYWIDRLPKPSDRNPRQASLAEVALWHLSFPTSSIYIERVFAKMRMMGVPQRLSAENETFARELLFRANPTLMQELLGKSKIAFKSV